MSTLTGPRLDSPWGAVQSRKEHAPGLLEVSTPGHGGVRVDLEFARERLSQEAQSRGMREQGFLWYEEDIDWAIVMYELPDLWPSFFARSGADFATEAQQRAYIRQVLARWRPEFLAFHDAREASEAKEVKSEC